MPARVAGVVALCALVPVAFVASTLVLLLAANAVLVAVAAWEAWAWRSR
jgi:low temperature requirement protein LtrA